MSQTLLALGIFAVGFIGMAIGVIVAGKRGELKGSCGGVGSNPDCCMTCPSRASCDDAKVDRSVPASQQGMPARAEPLAE